jgi:hypothetical protein
MMSTSFVIVAPRIQSPVGLPDVTITARSPERSPGRISGGPERRSDGVAITVAVQVDEREVESLQQSDNDDDDDDDGTPSYMLSYDPVPGVFNLDHAIEEAREEGDGGDSDEAGDEVLLHDEARLEVDQDLQEAQDDNEALEDKDANSIFMARNNPRMAIDPLIKLPPPPDTRVTPLPKVDKGEPMYDQVDTPGNWQEYTHCAKF